MKIKEEESDDCFNDIIDEDQLYNLCNIIYRLKQNMKIEDIVNNEITLTDVITERIFTQMMHEPIDNFNILHKTQKRHDYEFRIGNTFVTLSRVSLRDEQFHVKFFDMRNGGYEPLKEPYMKFKISAEFVHRISG